MAAAELPTFLTSSTTMVSTSFVEQARTLEQVEAIGGSGSFVYEVDGKVRGAIFVENRRVCWAAAAGLGRRLGDILVARSGVPRATLDLVVEDCKKTGTPFGERLVAMGVVDETSLRQALLEHTVESLDALLRVPSERRWVPRGAGAGYQPRFTFGTGEVLGASGRARMAIETAELDAVDQSLSPDDAAVLVRVGPGSVPVRTRGIFSASAAMTLTAARLAAGLASAAERFCGARGPTVAGTTDEGRSYVTWEQGRLRAMVLAEGSMAAGRLLSRLAARRG